MTPILLPIMSTICGGVLDMEQRLYPLVDMERNSNCLKERVVHEPFEFFLLKLIFVQRNFWRGVLILAIMLSSKRMKQFPRARPS